MNRRVYVISSIWFLVIIMMAAHLGAAEKRITQFTRGGDPAVSQPISATGNRPANYGLGVAVQVGLKKAALFCNLSVIHNGDYEDGADVYLFDSLKTLGNEQPIPMTRIEKEKDAKTGEPRFILKFPLIPGFWPLGAKRQDGTPHPGAGKGFAFAQALSLPGTGDTLTADMYKSLIRYVEVLQLAFDGQKLVITERKLVKPGQEWVTTNGWSVFSPGLHAAIPDGDDLLLAVTASSKKEGIKTGVCRFCFSGTQWLPVLFTPVNGGNEPSIARRADGSFVFTARTYGKNGGSNVSESIEIWAAQDADGPWSQIICSDNQRAQAPITVNATTDGIIFILTNPVGMTSVDGTMGWHQWRRARLVLWQLDQNEPKFNPPRPRIIRDGPEEFGRQPGSRWVIDHPMSTVVQLGDGLWHCLVVYRVQNAPAIKTPHHGCHIQEIITSQPETPPWQF